MDSVTSPSRRQAAGPFRIPRGSLLALTMLMVVGTACSDADLLTHPLDPAFAVIDVPTGTGDRTTEINDSLAAAAPGDVVLLGTGTYEFSGVIMVPSYVTLAAPVRGTASQPNLRATGSNAYVSLAVTNTEVEAGLRDLYIDGANVSNTNGIQTSGATNFRIDTVTVARFGAAGINTGAAAGGTITNCTVANNGDAGIQISWASKQISVTGCTVYGNYKNGIDVNGDSIWIAKNTVYNNGNTDRQDSDRNGILVWGANSSGVLNVDIYDNDVYDNYRHGIVVTSTNTTVDGTWVAANLVWGHDTVNGGGVGIYVEGSDSIVKRTRNTLVQYNRAEYNAWGFHSGDGAHAWDYDTSVLNNYWPDNWIKCAEYGAGVTTISGNTTNGNVSC